jgi:hypothetical protein
MANPARRSTTKLHTLARQGSNDNAFVYGNFLFHNRYEMPDRFTGGSLTIWDGGHGPSDYAEVTSNTVDNFDWIQPSSGTINGCPVTVTDGSAPGAVEVDQGVGNTFHNNEIRRTLSFGMVLFRTEDTVITGNNPWNSSDTPWYIWGHDISAIWFNAGAYPQNNKRPTLDHVRIVANGDLAPSNEWKAVIFDSVEGGSTYGFTSDACMYQNAQGNVASWNNNGSNTVNTTPSSFSACP